LLSLETINNVISLLENGFSRRKTAKLADVSVSTVQRIASGKRSRTGHTSRAFNALVNSDPIRVPLELRGDTLRRYLDMRNQKRNNPQPQ
jgi:transcriptional regulator with XRE-family HTH domain